MNARVLPLCLLLALRVSAASALPTSADPSIGVAGAATDPPAAQGRIRDTGRRLGELAIGHGPHKSSALALRALPPPLRNRLIRGRLAVDEESMRGVRITLASSGEELVAAAGLVHDMYVRRGISTPDPSGLRVTVHAAHPRTAVFVARREGRVIGTVSLVVDSALGVPMEKIYPREVAGLRAAGRIVAEVGALAIAPGERGQGLMHFLNKAMFDYARLIGVDDLVAAVHPDVEDLYRATLLFQRMGPVKVYPGLDRSALATPLRLDLGTAPARMRAAYRGTRGFNLYEFYVLKKPVEIDLPSRPQLSAQAKQRVKACAHLLGRRPATLVEASPAQRRALAVAGVLGLRTRARVHVGGRSLRTR